MLEEFQYGDVREIRLARPPANAFDQALVIQLTQRLRAASLEGTRGVVLSGTPGMFSGGLDVPILSVLEWNELQSLLRSLLMLMHQLAIQPIPVAAAINGHCIAMATVLATLCDYRVMSEGAYKIGMNEVAIGLCPGPVAFGAMRRLLGVRHAEQLVTSGRLLSPEDALRIGLVDRLTPLEQTTQAAIDYMQGMVKLPQQALYDSRRLARADLMALCEEGIRHDSMLMHKSWFGGEARQRLQLLAAELSNE